LAHFLIGRIVAFVALEEGGLVWQEFYAAFLVVRASLSPRSTVPAGIATPLKRCFKGIAKLFRPLRN
jgi:hypothetical protein